MNISLFIIRRGVLVIIGVAAVVLAVVEPINLGRLPQAAPSLSSYRTEPASRLRSSSFDQLSQEEAGR